MNVFIKKKHKRVSSIFAFLLAFAMVFGIMSVYTVTSKAADREATISDVTIEGKVGEYINDTKIATIMFPEGVIPTFQGSAQITDSNAPDGIGLSLEVVSGNKTQGDLYIRGKPKTAVTDTLRLTLPKDYFWDKNALTYLPLVVTANPNAKWNIQGVKVTEIAVNSSADTLKVNDTLQMTVIVIPDNALDKTVTWSIVNKTGEAAISSSGLLTASRPGTVTVKALASDGSEIFGTKDITITAEAVKVTAITVSAASDSLKVDNTLQMTASVTPENAADASVTWSVANKTGEATIDSAGLLTASKPGTVTVKALANDGSGIYGTKDITIAAKDAPEYKFTEGANGKWQLGSKSGLTFKANGSLSDFVAVKINGEVLDSSNYTMKEGSTIVTLKPEYLNTLKAATYELTIVYTDTTVKTNFTVEAKKTTPETTTPKADTPKSSTPKTGDSTNVMLCFALLLISGCTVAIITYKKRKTI